MVTGNALEATPKCETTSVELPTGTPAGTTTSNSTATFLTIQESDTMPGNPPTVTAQLRAPSTAQVPKTCATPPWQITGLPRKSETEVITGAWPQAAADPASRTAHTHREVLFIDRSIAHAHGTPGSPFM